VTVRRRGSRLRHRRSSLRGEGRRRDRFEDLVGRAIDGLPAQFRELLDRVAIVLDDEPSGEQLREEGLGPGETLYGLYEGTPLIAYGADDVPFPNKITLFRLPLEEDYPDPAELEAEIRRTLHHELAHHLGFDEPGMERLGLD
jgi:predicted Zn-dependent protease with MMP-like domain